MVRRRQYHHYLSVLLVALVSVACSSSGGGSTTQPGNAGGSSYTFYSVTHGELGDAYWAVYRKGLQDAGARYGVTVKDVGCQKFSIQCLVNNLDSAVSAKPDGILLTITDASAVDSSSRRAIGQGISIIAVNVDDPRPKAQRIPYLYYIGSNEYLIGQVSGERMLKERTPKRAACANQEPGHIGLETRCQGFLDLMTKAGVPTDKLATGTDPTQAASVLRGYFTSHPDADGLFSLGGASFTPALQVLNDPQFKSRNILHATVDLSSGQLDAVIKGQAVSTIAAQQYLQGYLGVEGLYLHKKFGFTMASDQLTGPFLIDKTNASQVQDLVKSGLA